MQAARVNLGQVGWDRIIFALQVLVSHLEPRCEPIADRPKLPRGFTWQDLKDLIRQEASHGIWTEMYRHPDGSTGEVGYVRVQRREEADNLYSKSTSANNSNVLECRVTFAAQISWSTLADCKSIYSTPARLFRRRYAALAAMDSALQPSAAKLLRSTVSWRLHPGRHWDRKQAMSNLL